ncbi:MAG: hypothetical protein LBL72_01140 [Candidatus Accumulibacter sp.]|jgi:hypothetical protein|nr:hypothetical protein [Accumulibacter sp.]
MNDAQVLSRLQRILTVENGLHKEQANSRLAWRLDDASGDFLGYLKEVGESNRPEQIVAAEKAILENELVEYANSKGMVSSLNAALAELTATEKLLAIVDDPVKYRPVDQSHSLPRNREKGLPLDEARQAFKSHTARLNNLDKARLPDNEKKIIDARKRAVSNAARLYALRQAKTLGLAPAESA